jgi:hypothetical protein
MTYRVLKPLRWGGVQLLPGELLTHIPGRRYETMVDNGEIEVADSAAEAQKKPRGRPPKHVTA